MSRFRVEYSDDGMPDHEELQRIGDTIEKKGGESPILKGEEEKFLRLNMVHVPQGVFWWLVDEANDRGWSKDVFAGWCIAEMRRIMIEQGEPKDNLTRRLRAEVESAKYADAYRIANIYKETPSDNIEQLLTDACDDIGLTPRELLERVKSDPFPEYAQRYDQRTDTKTKRCTRFMADLFRDRDRIPSEELNEKCQQAGFNKSMIQEARKRLGIQPIQTDEGWFCVRPRSSKVLIPN